MGSAEFARPVKPELARSSHCPSRLVVVACHPRDAMRSRSSTPIVPPRVSAVPSSAPLLFPDSGPRTATQPNCRLPDEVMRHRQVHPQESRHAAERSVHPTHPCPLDDITRRAIGFA